LCTSLWNKPSEWDKDCLLCDRDKFLIKSAKHLSSNVYDMNHEYKQTLTYAKVMVSEDF